MADVVDPLENELRGAASHLAWPETPDVAGKVHELVGDAAPRGRRWTRRATVVGLVALAGLGGSVVYASWLGVRGVGIVIDGSLVPAPVAADLGLGDRRTLAEAAAEVDFAILVPAELGEPDEAYVLTDARGGPPGGQVTLVYRAGPDLPRAEETGVGVLVTQFLGSADRGVIQKLVDSGAAVEPVMAGDGTAYWIGESHAVFYLDADGQFREDTLRAAAETLLLTRGEVTVRLEAGLPRHRVLEIAATLR